jgi:hypothetical protein
MKSFAIWLVLFVVVAGVAAVYGAPAGDDVLKRSVNESGSGESMLMMTVNGISNAIGGKVWM